MEMLKLNFILINFLLKRRTRTEQENCVFLIKHSSYIYFLWLYHREIGIDNLQIVKFH